MNVLIMGYLKVLLNKEIFWSGLFKGVVDYDLIFLTLFSV